MLTLTEMQTLVLKVLLEVQVVVEDFLQLVHQEVQLLNQLNQETLALTDLETRVDLVQDITQIKVAEEVLVQQVKQALVRVKVVYVELILFQMVLLQCIMLVVGVVLVKVTEDKVEVHNMLQVLILVLQVVVRQVFQLIFQEKQDKVLRIEVEALVVLTIVVYLVQDGHLNTM